MTVLDEYTALLKLDRKNSSWSRQQTLASRLLCLKDEVREVSEAIEANDLKSLRDELGDALMNVIYLMIIAEEHGAGSPDDMIRDAIAKLSRRKPWIMHGERLDPAEEMRRWLAAKHREKAATGHNNVHKQ